MTTWTDIDEPVLRFLAEQPASVMPGWDWHLALRPPVDSSEIQGLDERQIDEALFRLESVGLMDSRDRSETVAYAVWYKPRVTALGSMVLGVWPDLDRVDAVESLQVSLAALAEQEPDSERQGALRRAAAMLASLSGSIATRLAADAAAQAGGDFG